MVVRAEGGKLQRHPWLRRLRDWIEAHRGERRSITELTETLTREIQERFFGALPRSLGGGLYWQALLEHPSNEGPRRGHLIRLRPKRAGKIAALMNEVARLAEDEAYRRPARRWLKLLKAQALDRSEGADHPGRRQRDRGGRGVAQAGAFRSRPTAPSASPAFSMIS